MMQVKEHCRLCNSLSPIFQYSEDRHYFKCSTCFGIFVSEQFLPNERDEVNRYHAHNNDVNDRGYQQFVSPVTKAITNGFDKHHFGLDFGSGPGPVITAILQEKGYKIETYDPYFDNKPEILTNTYDYIACCEVVEHFHEPNLEFQKLNSLLKPSGKLFIMTNLFHDKIDFNEWYYKNDQTHVFFYQKLTFQWIKETYGFKSVEFKDRLIILTA